MTGWKHVDRIIGWAETNPDRVFWIGLAMLTFVSMLGF